MGTFFIEIDPNASFAAAPSVGTEPSAAIVIPAGVPLDTLTSQHEIVTLEKIIEKPIEVVKEVIVEKIIEVPVEKIVEKQVTVVEIQKVEVPVEVIKEVVKEIEIPIEIEKLVIRDVVHKDITSIVIFSTLALLAGIIIGRI